MNTKTTQQGFSGKSNKRHLDAGARSVSILEALLGRLFPAPPLAPDYARFPDLPDAGLKFERKARDELQRSYDRLSCGRSAPLKQNRKG